MAPRSKGKEGEGEMREILFRGETEKFGNWIEGSLIVGRDLESGQLEYLIAPLSAYYTEVKKVTPKTVGQYTGLIDKNGKKIFEGDIMPVYEQGEEYYYKVVYNGDCFMFSMLDSEQGSYPLSTKNAISEVIGNIHDNPELLRTPQKDEVRE